VVPVDVAGVAVVAAAAAEAAGPGEASRVIAGVIPPLPTSAVPATVSPADAMMTLVEVIGALHRQVMNHTKAIEAVTLAVGGVCAGVKKLQTASGGASRKRKRAATADGSAGAGAPTGGPLSSLDTGAPSSSEPPLSPTLLALTREVAGAAAAPPKKKQKKEAGGGKKKKKIREDDEDDGPEDEEDRQKRKKKAKTQAASESKNKKKASGKSKKDKAVVQLLPEDDPDVASADLGIPDDG